MAQFPANIAPSWISNLEPSERPQVEQQFEAGGLSRLRVSQVKKGGRFTVTFNDLDCVVPLSTVMDFWNQVERHEEVTFTLGFFKGFSTTVRTEVLSWSPLGNWRFAGRPRIELVNTDIVSLTAQFEAIVD